MLDAVTNARVIFISVAFIAGFGTFFWGNYVEDQTYYKNQRPAHCMDGMRIGYSKSTAKFTGDDSDIHKGMVKYKCSYPVAVYPCYDTVDADTWEGHCSNLAEGPLEPWKIKEVTDVHRCVQPGAWATSIPNCDERKWTCRNGACDGYQKGLEICAGKITARPYRCWYTEETEEVRTEAAAFPVGWLIGGVCISALALCCCACCIYSMIGEENVAEKSCQTLAALVCMVGLIFAISAIVKATRGADQQGPQETSYGDVYGHEEDYHGDSQPAPAPAASADAPAPEPEGSSLTMWIAIGCSISAFLILVAAVLLIRMKRRGRDVRERLKVPVEANFERFKIEFDLVKANADGRKQGGPKNESSEPARMATKCAASQIPSLKVGYPCSFYGSQEAVPGEGLLCSQHFRQRVQQLEKEAQLSMTDRLCHKMLVESERSSEFAQGMGARLGLGNKVTNIVAAKKVGKIWRQKARASASGKVEDEEAANPNQAAGLELERVETE